MRLVLLLQLLVLLAVFLACSSCGGGRSGSLEPRAGVDDVGDSVRGDGATLQGGVLATLATGGEQFRVWVTRPGTAQLLVDVWRGTASMSMVRGTLVAGAGAASHNAPWSWHLSPESVQIDPFGVGVCHTRPSVVEIDAPTFANASCLWGGVTLVGLMDKR